MTHHRSTLPPWNRTAIKGILLSALGLCAFAAWGEASDSDWLPAAGGVDSLAVQTLVQALEYLDVTLLELGFDKLYAEDDTFRLEIVEAILNDPLMLPGFHSDAVARIRDTLADFTGLGGLAASLGELAEAPPALAGKRARPVMPWGRAALLYPAGESPFQGAVDVFLHVCHQAQDGLDEAFSGLTPEDRAHVVMAASAFWGDQDDPEDAAAKGAILREFGMPADTTGLLNEDRILDAGARMNRGALTEASRVFADAVVRLRADVEAVRHADIGQIPSEPQRVVDGLDGDVRAVFDTPWGLLAICGEGPNSYGPEALRRIAFVVDLGGDDVYRGRVASAVGGLLRALSAVVDISGDDLYDAQGRAFCIGGAVLGLAVLLDLDGDDVYRGGDGSAGAGFFGAGFLVDGGGRDLLEGRNFCQGAGAFGMGALVSLVADDPPPEQEIEPDRAFDLSLVKVPGTGARPVRHDDNDTYLCARQSQGFASTFGIGLLYDKAGNDVYRAGGRYLHRPLLPHDFQSLSQGFAIGFRPRAAGGVGLLIDEEGNDFYHAEVYAQGASYWYSLGLLFDGGGNDRYVATQYAQGAGIHLSIGALWDRGGDDHYVCKFGVTQGTGHDLSVGMLLEESGNDYYVVSDGQGMSIANSVGIFVDAQGDDLYATTGTGQGAATWARGFSGLGLFLDLEGRDTYPRGSAGEDSAAWSSSLFSIGIDLPRDIVLPDEVIPDPVLTAEDSARVLDELFATASLWEVGSARERVRRARAALMTRGIEAVNYAVEHKLGSRDGLEYRTLVEIGKAFPDSFAARIISRLDDSDDQVVRNVIGLLGEMKRVDARPPLERMLRDGRRQSHWTRVITALGALGDSAAAPSLRPFLHDEMERRRIQASAALGALGDTTSIPALVGLLADPTLTVRAAASKALVSFGPGAVSAVSLAIGSHMPNTVSQESPGSGAGILSSRVVHIRTLGQIVTAILDSAPPDCLRARALGRRTMMHALDAWSEPSGAPERMAAVEALLGLGDRETRDFVRLRMHDETDPLVLRAFSRLEVGEE